MSTQQILTLPQRKLWRALVIRGYVRDSNYEGVVAFSCGNATRALKDVGLDVLDLSPHGDLAPTRWWTPAEVQRYFPTRFDATSGHLPLHLMFAIGKYFKSNMPVLDPKIEYGVPSGSGETIVCLRLVYPLIRFKPMYGGNHSTQYDLQAPLNQLVTNLTTYE